MRLRDLKSGYFFKFVDGGFGDICYHAGLEIFNITLNTSFTYEEARRDLDRPIIKLNAMFEEIVEPKEEKELCGAQA